jgi:3-isopropylmalate/(R)-2-methylmalate dehydratase small subunit
MEPTRIVVGRMVPLMRASIDTDQIIPHRYLTRVERAGFGEFLFCDWAHLGDGSLDPSFELNRPQYRGATVLVAGPNFGSGSSREHAPWALQDYGFSAVIAASFADIFRANCFKVGLPAIVLSAGEVAALASLAAGDPSAQVTIDIEAQTVSAAGVAASFEITPEVKRVLLGGLDEVLVTLERAVDITEYEARRPRFRPSMGDGGSGPPKGARNG